jgi:HlyD family secretion protein
VLSALLACRPADERDPPSAVVERGELVVRLDLAGELEAVRTTPVVVPDIGTGAQVTFLAAEGLRVAAGDVLAELDKSELDRRLLQAQNQQEVSRTRIKQQQAQLELRLADLGAAVERAELNLKGAQMRVTDSEAVPRVERDAARLQVQQASLALDQAKAALETARLQGEAQLELLGIEARQGQELLARTRGQLAAVILRAPIAGVVVHAEAPEGRPIGQGYLVYPGTRIVALADPSELHAVAWVHELDAGKLAPGLPVVLTLDAMPDRTFAGEIQGVGDMAVSGGGGAPGKRLRADIALGEVDPAMRPGMSVRVELEVGRTADALTVPREAVFDRAGRACVLRQVAGGWQEVEVRRGMADASRVAVEGDLTEGDRVALEDRGTAGEADPPASGGAGT